MSKNAIILGVGLADNVSKQLDTMANRLRGKMRNLASVGSELSMGITLPIVAAGAATLKFAGDLDALKKALAATMGSASAAEAEFLKLKEAAKAPGIGLEEAVKGSFLLQGLGDSADEARQQMLALAKAVSLSGGGEAQFAGVLHQFTQMRGVGKILGGDIRFMIENAPILSKVMNDAFGTANPEKIRDMGISVDQFVTKLMSGLEGMQGIAGSLKNDMENVWTSIRVGVGEIGLAILGTGDWQEGMSKLSDTITQVSGNVVKWIRENQWLTDTLVKLAAGMAVTGPIIRFVGDMGLAATTVALFTTKIYGLLAAVGSSTFQYFSSGGWMKASALGWAGIALAINEAVQSFRKWETQWINSSFSKDGGTILNRLSAFASGFWDIQGLQFGAGMKKMRQAFGDATPTGAFAVPKGKYSGMGAGKFGGRSFGIKPSTPPPPPPGDTGGPFLYDKPDYFNEFSTPEDAPSLEKLMDGFSPVDYSKTMPLFGLDLDALDSIRTAKDVMIEYQEEMASARIEQSLGADATKVMGMEVDALATKYREMASLYGEASTFAVDALSAWEAANKKFTESQKLQNDELERKNRALEYGKMALDGVSAAVSGLVSKGGGFKEFAAGIMKAVAAMAKLAIAEFVAKTIGALGFVGAIPAIVGGGILAGALDGLLGRVSLAKGGVVTGETLVRAGEYPNAHINPEVISPVNIMQKYIREAVGDMGGGGGGTFRILGDDLVLQTSKAHSRGMRRGSGSNTIIF